MAGIPNYPIAYESFGCMCLLDCVCQSSGLHQATPTGCELPDERILRCRSPSVLHGHDACMRGTYSGSDATIRLRKAFGLAMSPDRQSSYLHYRVAGQFLVPLDSAIP